MLDRHNPQVGDIVYKPYSPGCVGIIRRVIFKRRDSIWTWNVKVEVEWARKKKPRKEEILTIGLKSIDKLIADHKKKIKTLTASRKKALAL